MICAICTCISFNYETRGSWRQRALLFLTNYSNCRNIQRWNEVWGTRIIWDYIFIGINSLFLIILYDQLSLLYVPYYFSVCQNLQVIEVWQKYWEMFKNLIRGNSVLYSCFRCPLVPLYNQTQICSYMLHVIMLQMKTKFVMDHEYMYIQFTNVCLLCWNIPRSFGMKRLWPWPNLGTQFSVCQNNVYILSMDLAYKLCPMNIRRIGDMLVDLRRNI